MIKVIPNKKNIGAEIVCDLRKFSKEDFKKLKFFFKKSAITKLTKLINNSRKYK